MQAINLFASARNQIELDNGMEELIQILLKVGNNPLDEPMSVFVATAGIIAANVDGNVTKEEYEQIIRTLSGSNIFPKSFLESVLKEDVDALFEKSVSTILSINPGLKPSLLEYMIGIILSDREIGEKEVNFIYGIGKSLGLSVKEISVLFAGMVQRNFNPSLDAIS